MMQILSFHCFKIIYVIKFKPSTAIADIINNNKIIYFKTQMYILLNNKHMLKQNLISKKVSQYKYLIFI